MRTLTSIFLLVLLGLALHAHCEEAMDQSARDEERGILECIFEDNSANCLRTRLARDLDQIEREVTGKKSQPPMSVVLEQAGGIIAEVVDDLQETGAEGIIGEDEAQDDEIEETRKIKFGKKKKKKQLQKLLGLAMLLKAKLSLLLQLISTHFQLKFFVIAIISLLINATRFWLELKKGHPSKVIYYEHAQHQHHYDHDDHDHGYWGRSSNETPMDLAYRAYVPTE
ncbi:PREDICTED: uncharacterized protein LOC106743121 [Dinoponera quadriceps]|uniref:Uncharacterized protein LOC106743121 n=1 Tax=Dinoponera quadriceps TaxID=609295 RepID=A0A6P3X1R8_DINQU|nr:PREDICTED: uncharacterized protein LOC106743121 [Dinoponera quadriceps]